MVAYSGRLIFNKLRPEDYGSYTCVVETDSGRLIRKEFIVGDRHSVGDAEHIHHSKPPVVRIIPIIKDVREGGRIELECETGINS